MKEIVMQEKPYVGNLQMRFDGGDGASSATRRRALLYTLIFLSSALVSLPAFANFTATTNGTEVFFSVTGAEYTHTQPCLREDVSKVFIDARKPLLWYVDSPSTHTGGTEVQYGQLYLNSGDALGSGPLYLGDNGSLVVPGTFVATISNKVVFGQTSSSYATSLANGRLTLNSVGTPVVGETHRIRLGRTTAGSASHITLALTDDSSEAVNEIILSGAVDLTLDGGTVKARADAAKPFFTVATIGDAMNAKISQRGITFDVASGGELVPGGAFAFESGTATNIVETYYPNDWSFEGELIGMSGAFSGGWMLEPSGGNVYGETSQVRRNGSAFDTSGDTEWTTTNDNYYAMIRRATALYQDINVPADGFWRVVFEQGCRPGTTYASVSMTMTVTVDGETWFVVPAVPDAASAHGFKEFRSGAFALTAGSHRLKFAVSDVNLGQRNLNLDAVRLERIEEVSSKGDFAKTGSGTVTLAGQALDGVVVSDSGGVLTLCDCGLDGATVSVASGAKVELFGTSCASIASVSVASGGTLVLGEAAGNLITNGNFEADGAVFLSRTSPFGWFGERLDARPKTGGGFGVQTNGYAFSEDGPYTSHGDSSLFLRVSNRVSQAFSVVAAGTYAVTFMQACRRHLASNTLQNSVAIDGEEILVTPVTGGYYGYTRFKTTKELSPGQHILSFTTNDTEGENLGEVVLVDDVCVALVGDTPPSGLSLSLATGSVLRLENSQTFNISDISVNGHPFKGGRSALVAAGVIVEGSGGIRAGGDFGTMFIVR